MSTHSALLHHSQLRIVLTFAVTILVGISFWLHPGSRVLQEPLELFLAWTTGAFLRLLNPGVSIQGASVSIDGFAANVVPACTGLFTMTIYAAAVLAYPCAWKRKLQGVLLGISAIVALNWVRIISLLLIGAYWPQVFDFAHLVVWQSVALVFAAFVWLYWMQRYAHAR